MAVQVIQMFPPTIMTTSPVSVFVMPAAPTQQVLNRGRIRFTNTDTVAHTVTAYELVSGSTVTSSFCPALNVPPNSNLDIDVPVIAAGGTIQAFASIGTVVIAHALDGVLFS